MVFSSKSPEGKDYDQPTARRRAVAVAGAGLLALVGTIYLIKQQLSFTPAEEKTLPRSEDISIQRVSNVGPAGNPEVTDLEGSFISRPVNLRDALTTIELDIMYGHVRGYKPPRSVDTVRCTDDASRLYTATVTAGSFACEIVFTPDSAPVTPTT